MRKVDAQSHTEPIIAIVAQHCAEAAFLWTQRTAAVSSPQFRLLELARLDDRVEAHLDGLTVAGEVGWELCRESLEGTEEIFTASVVAFKSGRVELIDSVLPIATKSPALSRGVISALAWVPVNQAQPHITRFLEDPDAVLRRIGMAASAARRYRTGRIDSWIDDGDPQNRARACRSIGEFGEKRLIGQLWTRLKDSDDSCRFWAAWSVGLLEGDLDALEVLKTTAVPQAAEATTILASRLHTAEARAWIDHLAADPPRRRSAVSAAGARGDPHFSDWLIAQMRDPLLARAAGESFTMITGADLRDEKLESELPETIQSGPTDDPADENVDIDPDEHLSWPDVVAVERWWMAHHHHFSPGTRYLLGKPISVEWCQHVLRMGRQRQRAAAALELAILQPGQPLFNVAAPGFRQQQMLGIKK